MRISDHQVVVLMNVLFHSLSICGPFAGLSVEQRLELYNGLLNQQSKLIVEIDPSEKEVQSGA